MNIIAGGITIVNTLRPSPGTKTGNPDRTDKTRRMIHMFSKQIPAPMLEAKFDSSIKERCCCYLCACYRNLN